MKHILSRVTSSGKTLNKLKIADFEADFYVVHTESDGLGIDTTTINFLNKFEGGWFSKDSAELVGTAKLVGDFVVERIPDATF